MPQDWDFSGIPRAGRNTPEEFDFTGIPKLPPSGMKSAWDWFMNPLTEVPGALYKTYVDTVYPNAWEWPKKLGESVINQATSPASIVEAGSALLSSGTTLIPSMIRRGALLANRGVNTAYAAEGGMDMYNQPTWAGKGLGALEAIGGLAGLKYKPKGLYPEPPVEKPPVNWMPEPTPIREGWLPDNLNDPLPPWNAAENHLPGFEYGAKHQVPREQIPFQNADPTLGFRAQTNPAQSLGYPLDVVPNRLRPRAVQSGLGSQIPENMFDRINNPPPAKPGEFIPQPDPRSVDDIFKADWLKNNPPPVPLTPEQRISNMIQSIDDVMKGKTTSPLTKTEAALRMADQIENSTGRSGKIKKFVEQFVDDTKGELDLEVLKDNLARFLKGTGQLPVGEMGRVAKFAKAGAQEVPNERSYIEKVLSEFITDTKGEFDPNALKEKLKSLNPNSIAVRWQEIANELDAAKAPDLNYRELFSTGSKNALKKGETWRSRVLKYIELDKNRQLAALEEKEPSIKNFFNDESGAFNYKKLRETILKTMGPKGARAIRAQLQGALAKLDANPNVGEGAYRDLLPPELQKPLRGGETYRSRVIDFMNGVASPYQAPGTSPVRDITVGRFVQALRDAHPTRAMQDAMDSAERGKRFSAMGRVKTTGMAGMYERLGKMKGKLPVANYRPVKLSQEDLTGLTNLIHNSDLDLGDKLHAYTGLSKLIGEHPSGRVPQPGELAKLERVFGKEAMDEIRELHAGIGGLPMKMLHEGVNLPKSIMATADLSAPLRQGSGLILTKAFWTNFKTLFQTYGSETAFEAVMDSMRKHPAYEEMKKAGLAIDDLKHIEGREEAIMSSLTEKFKIGTGDWGIKPARASNRAYQAYLAKLRFDTYNKLMESAKTSGGGILDMGKKLIGKEVPGEHDFIDSPAFKKALATYINDATGRGHLAGAEPAALFLNTFLFSPRLMASRINMLNPYTYVKADPFIRKQYLKSLIGIATMGTTVTELAKQFGGKVGEDPTSADYKKVQVGNVRLDPWGGFQQYIVLADRLREGKYTSTITGRTTDLNSPRFNSRTYKDTLESFMVSKGNPVMTYMYGLMTGKGFDNMPFQYKRELWDRITPMVIGDMVELYKEDPENTPLPAKLLMGSGALFGMGLQTYQPTNRRATRGQAEESWNPFGDRFAPSSLVP